MAQWCYKVVDTVCSCILAQHDARATGAADWRRAEVIIEEAKQAALAEQNRIKAAAQAELEQEMSRAKDQLRTQVANLAIIGAEKILSAEVDRNRHEAMLNELAGQL